MDNADRVEKFLTDHTGRFYCNRCLSDEVPVMNAAQVNLITRDLRGVTPYRGGKMICARCGDDRECIAYGSDPTASSSSDP